MKIRANSPPPNSVLKPDTSSDSPSAKSKGVRFVSATILTNSSNPAGAPRIVLNELTKERLFRLNPVLKRKKTNKNRAKEISYEMVWATPRNLPSREYFELDLHP